MASEDYCVQVATVKHVEAIVALLAETFTPFVDQFCPTALRFDAERIEVELSRWVLVCHSEQVVACIRSWHEHDYQTFCFLATHPAHRRRGLGRTLIGYAVGQAMQSGCRKICIALRRSLRENIDYFTGAGFIYRGPFVTAEHDIYQLDWGAK